MSEISDFLARKGKEWLKDEWERSKKKARDEEWPNRYHHLRDTGYYEAII